MNRKTLLLGVIVLVALMVPAAAGGATGFQIREVTSTSQVRLWGDRQGHPLTSCSSSLAVHEIGVIRSASAGQSTVTCEAYGGGTLKPFNLDR